ncbi:hypothetical protein B0H10DRAFT_2206167 [Mycena sp. CBHHK59/15]|nr:hypothetical protein B0H10DRAFT_2206167 [Mycena sp. CBHHK59/15]
MCIIHSRDLWDIQPSGRWTLLREPEILMDMDHRLKKLHSVIWQRGWSCGSRDVGWVVEVMGGGNASDFFCEERGGDGKPDAASEQAWEKWGWWWYRIKEPRYGNYISYIFDPNCDPDFDPNLASTWVTTWSHFVTRKDGRWSKSASSSWGNKLESKLDVQYMVVTGPKLEAQIICTSMVGMKQRKGANSNICHCLLMGHTCMWHTGWAQAGATQSMMAVAISRRWWCQWQGGKQYSSSWSLEMTKSIQKCAKGTATHSHLCLTGVGTLLASYALRLAAIPLLHVPTCIILGS